MSESMFAGDTHDTMHTLALMDEVGKGIAVFRFYGARYPAFSSLIKADLLTRLRLTCSGRVKVPDTSDVAQPWHDGKVP